MTMHPTRTTLALLLTMLTSIAHAQGNTDGMVSGFNNDIDAALRLNTAQIVADPMLNAYFNR